MDEVSLHSKRTPQISLPKMESSDVPDLKATVCANTITNTNPESYPAK